MLTKQPKVCFNKLKEFIFVSSRIANINSTKQEFVNVFGNVNISDIEDYHIRFIVNSPIYDTFILYIYYIIIVAVLYNFLSYLFFGSTLGQKLLSLKVVNINNDNKPNCFKLFLKAILVQFPIKLIYLMIIGQLLYLVNFHKYAPIDGISTEILVNITSISNIYTIGLALFMFLLFWYDIYFITDKLILSDLISRTRVIEAKKYNFNKQEVLVEKSNFTSIVDWILDGLYKVNTSLKNTLKKWINYLK